MPVSGLDGYPAKKVPSFLTPEALRALAEGHAFQHVFYGLARRISFTFFFFLEKGGSSTGREGHQFS